MTANTEPGEQGSGLLRLSHRLVAMHVAGILLLILIVSSSVLWISAEHNRLARASSERLVDSGITAFRAKAFTLVKDYSIWDEGYDAVLADDRDWLYSNIGSSVTEIGTFDLVALYTPGRGPIFGWVEGSPEAGETGILPDSVLEQILELADVVGTPSTANRTLITEFRGDPWIFSVSRVVPIEGAPPGMDLSELPRQIHGHRLTQERLTQIGQSLLAGELGLAAEPAAGQARIPLIDHAGNVLRYVVWTPPRPGASILRKAALPLALALVVTAVISGVSSRYTVRSARRLEQALFDAKAADRSKSEFLSNVSHELRTPMNGILGSAQLLALSDLDDEQRELVAVVTSSAGVQLSLISDLLDLSRMEGGNRRLVEEPFEPADVLREVAELIRVAAAKKGVGFNSDLGQIAGLTVHGDARAFRQIATNLLGNAVKFTDRGAVELRVRARDDDGAARLVIRVTDTGSGIPPDALPRIFERFYQVDGSLTRANEGTGLGLAISQKLARMMGGSIEVSSVMGSGTTFDVTLSLPVIAWRREARDAA